MAQLIMRGAIWYARIQKDGKDIWRSTHTGDRRKAEAALRRTVADVQGNTTVADALASLLAAFNREETTATGDVQKLATLTAPLRIHRQKSISPIGPMSPIRPIPY